MAAVDGDRVGAPVPAAGVPDRLAVPLAWAVKVTPGGSEPDWLRTGAGKPVVVTVKVLDEPWSKVAAPAEVMPGAASTVRVNDCVAVVPIPLAASTVMGYVPLVPAAGVPDSEAVPSPLSVKLTPLGRVPVFDSAGVG